MHYSVSCGETVWVCAMRLWYIVWHNMPLSESLVPTKEQLAVRIAAHVGAWLSAIFTKHRICPQGDIDCFCDVEVTGEA